MSNLSKSNVLLICKATLAMATRAIFILLIDSRAEIVVNLGRGAGFTKNSDGCQGVVRMGCIGK